MQRFQYGFTFDDQVNEGDMTIEKQGVGTVVDPMSLQYLVGGSVDYTEGLEGSRFIVTNPNAKAPAAAAPRSAFKASSPQREGANLKTVTLRLPFCFITDRYRPGQTSAASDASE